MTQAGEGRQDTPRAAGTTRTAELFELKSTSLAALTLVLRSSDLDQLAAALQARLGDTPDVFNHEPVVLELSQLPAPEASADAAGQLSLAVAAPQLDFPALQALLKRHRLQAVAVSGASPEQLAAAEAAGLAEADLDQRVEARAVAAAATPAAEVVREVIKEVIVEQVREVRVPGEPAKTVIVDKPLRSGQQVYAKGADLIVMALVNHGAEVIADGNIHVYAPLRGKAIAGARGNTEARIFAASMEAELIAIAGIYRTTENPLPDTVLGKPAQIRLDGEKLVMEALKL
ncbi:septum site-determining protein MinC [Paucibacter sp. APW11]|uniref:Probable septum site-determining protein MinC n=1 Tax=Roseateles aquae TaxID=3077235 RepID=A0ABU3P9N5_9BURK|nr:septum site-determining protein MinC [Paucibacter sp. APW11]MDT8999289.1 septum site-determining protein MinC [Paucibacter sp. APW11]